MRPPTEMQDFRKKELVLSDGRAVVHNLVQVTIGNAEFISAHGLTHNLIEFAGQSKVELACDQDFHPAASVWFKTDRRSPIQMLPEVERVQAAPDPRWVLRIHIRHRERSLHDGDRLDYEYELRALDMYRTPGPQRFALVAAHGAMHRAVLSVAHDDSYVMQSEPSFGVAASADPEYYIPYAEIAHEHTTGPGMTRCETSCTNVRGGIGVVWNGNFTTAVSRPRK